MRTMWYKGRENALRKTNAENGFPLLSKDCSQKRHIVRTERTKKRDLLRLSLSPSWESSDRMNPFFFSSVCPLIYVSRKSCQEIIPRAITFSEIELNPGILRLL